MTATVEIRTGTNTVLKYLTKPVVKTLSEALRERLIAAGREGTPLRLRGGGTKDFAPYLLMILVLMVRPYGIFGRRQIERV
mgnify:CR=1 FL=1